MKKLMILAVTLVATAMIGTADAAYIVVDDFTDGSISSQNATTGSAFELTMDGLTGVLGGSRRIDVVAATNYASVALNSFPEADPPPAFAVAASTNGKITSTLTYDNRTAGSPDTINGLGGINLYTGGALGFIINATTDHDSFFKWTVTDTLGRSISLTAPEPIMQPAADIYFAFASFNDGNPFTDFSSVRSIVLTITQDPTTEPGLDFVLTNIRTGVVPEPTSLALAGFAGIGMAVGAIRRRRQAKQAA